MPPSSPSASSLPSRRVLPRPPLPFLWREPRRRYHSTTSSALILPPPLPLPLPLLRRRPSALSSFPRAWSQRASSSQGEIGMLFRRARKQRRKKNSELPKQKRRKTKNSKQARPPPSSASVVVGSLLVFAVLVVRQARAQVLQRSRAGKREGEGEEHDDLFMLEREQQATSSLVQPPPFIDENLSLPTPQNRTPKLSAQAATRNPLRICSLLLPPVLMLIRQRRSSGRARRR